jgi:large subunit ribosomal protein L29
MSKFTPGKAAPAASLRPLAAAELEKRVREAREEAFQLRLRQAGGQLENPARLRALRREVARCQTLLRQKAAKA